MDFDDLPLQYAVLYVIGWFFVILVSSCLLLCVGHEIYGKNITVLSFFQKSQKTHEIKLIS